MVVLWRVRAVELDVAELLFVVVPLTELRRTVVPLDELLRREEALLERPLRAELLRNAEEAWRPFLLTEER